MYQKVKNLLKILLPKNILFRYEPEIRSMLYLFYKGSTYQCNICNKPLRKFVQQKDKDQLCPNCGSLSRTRRLWEIIHPDFLKAGSAILDFSPSRNIYRILKKNDQIQYISSVYEGDFFADCHYDITNIDTDDEQYDLIICYHVLEHIENDEQAMGELYRILKKGGKCMIQTPFKEGNMYENSSIHTPQDRLIHFGQADHVRIYSINGLKERLEQSGFSVEIKKFSEPDTNKAGFCTQETVLFCTK